MIIYLSGPITGSQNYRQEFSEAKAFWIRRGFEVINPVELDAILPGSIIRGAAQKLYGIEYEKIMDVDLALLRMCDAVGFLRGWEKSKGAMTEYQMAKITRKSIFTQGKCGWEEDLTAYFEDYPEEEEGPLPFDE